MMVVLGFSSRVGKIQDFMFFVFALLKCLITSLFLLQDNSQSFTAFAIEFPQYNSYLEFFYWVFY